MKKILVVLSLICFIGVNISKAQTAAATTQKEVKTEASAVKAADAPAMHSCCMHANAACCTKGTASNAKECTPAQKAACEKMGSKAKAEAKTEASESKTKSSN